MSQLCRWPLHLGPWTERPSLGRTVALAALLMLGATLRAEPPVIVLFDGKTLDGWKKTDFANAGTVRVEEGSIVLGLGNSMTGITSTRQDLPVDDFELSYEAMRLTGRDFFAAATFPVGKSHLTLVNGGWGGSVTGLSSIDGSDASENETGAYVKYADKTWYRFRVRVAGNVVRCWVDDKPIVDVNIEGRDIDTRIESEANKPLGFATWGTSGALRKVEIRKLPHNLVGTQAEDGTVTLPASTAEVHGKMLRYEPQPHKNTLGFWTVADDWASWDFDVRRPGAFRLIALVGCGKGSGGSTVEFRAADQVLKLEVAETGGFQMFVPRDLGRLVLDHPGRYRLEVRATSKPGTAVMDLREVKLTPTAESSAATK